jgi:lambda family phage portal protein
VHSADGIRRGDGPNDLAAGWARKLVAFDPFQFALDSEARAASVSRGNALTALSVGASGAVGNYYNGDKFLDSFGPTLSNTPDYWELRARSSQLFTENLYAAGLIRRIVTNEINTGLTLQAEPNDELLAGIDETSAEIWAEDVESRFEIWGDLPKMCDFEGTRSLAKLQEEARRESLIDGDILVVLRTNKRTGLPQIQLISGSRVVTPLRRDPQDRRDIRFGCELDSHGRIIAHHVSQTGSGLADTIRVPAFGPKSGKRMSWLQYGTDKRMNAVRGMPLLAIVLQSLKELDRYRDNEQRAAAVNALLALFIRKDQDKMGTNPWSGGAQRRTVVEGVGEDGAPREFNMTASNPGIVFEELQYGEVPESFNTQRPNVNYPKFEQAILRAIAWANQIPPEILMLEFSNNYSASKAAINEFKSYITMFRKDFGSTFCQPIYTEWLVAEVTASRIQAPGLLDARRSLALYVELGAWMRSVWAGPVKPSVDLGKDVKAYKEAIEANLISATRASEDLFGTRFTRALKRRAREIGAVQKMEEKLGIDAASVLEMEAKHAPKPAAPPSGNDANAMQTIIDAVLEEIQDYGTGSSTLN